MSQHLLKWQENMCGSNIFWLKKLKITLYKLIIFAVKKQSLYK